MDAELVVTTLLLPEFFEVLALCQFKSKWPILTLHLFFAEFLEQWTVNPQLGESNVTTVGVHSGVDQFKLRVLFLDNLLDLLPVNFEFILSFDISLVSDDNWIVEVLLDQKDLAILIKLVLNGLSCFLLSLDITLLNVVIVGKLLLGEGKVSSASDCIVFKFELGGVNTSLLDILDGPLFLLDVVTVEEVRDVEVTVLRGLDLLAEELVFGEVLVG